MDSTNNRSNSNNAQYNNYNTNNNNNNVSNNNNQNTSTTTNETNKKPSTMKMVNDKLRDIKKEAIVFLHRKVNKKVEFAVGLLRIAKNKFAGATTLNGNGVSKAAQAANSAWNYLMKTDKYFDRNGMDATDTRTLDAVKDNCAILGIKYVKIDEYDRKFSFTHEGKTLDYNGLIEVANKKINEFTSDAINAKTPDQKELANANITSAKEVLGSLLYERKYKKSTFTEKLGVPTSGPLGQHVAQGKRLIKLLVILPLAAGHWLLTSKTAFDLPSTGEAKDSQADKYNNLCKQLKVAFPLPKNIDVKVHHGTVQVTIDGRPRSLTELKKMAKGRNEWLNDLDAKSLNGTDSLKLRAYHAATSKIEEIGVFFSKRHTVSVYDDPDREDLNPKPTNQKFENPINSIKLAFFNVFKKKEKEDNKDNELTQI